MTRILIADDHEVVRFGLRAILEAHQGWQVVFRSAQLRASPVGTPQRATGRKNWTVSR